VDTVTIIIAIVATVLTTGVRYKRGIPNYATRRRIIVDVLNGSVIYPFALLIFSVFNPTIFKYLETSRLSVGLAGIVGVIFVIGELALSCSPERARDTAHPPDER
jgi:hypothetical protein